MPVSGGSLCTNLGKTMETFIVNGTHVYTIIQFCTALMKPAFTVLTSDPVYCSFTKDGPGVWGGGCRSWQMSHTPSEVPPSEEISESVEE